jgi:hypothetical protein
VCSVASLFHSSCDLLSCAHAPTARKGLISKDLVNIEEGNADKVEGSDLINVEKLSLLGKTLLQFLEWRSTPYDFEMDVQLRGFLKQYLPLTEDEQYEQSLKVEPRAS